MGSNHQRWAQISIVVQLIALIRTLAEYLRLVATGACADATLNQYVVAALFTAVLCSIAVILYFYGKFRSVALTGALTVVALIVYKFAFMS